MSFFDLAFLALDKLAEYSAQVPLICPNSAFLRYFGVNTTWYCDIAISLEGLAVPPRRSYDFVTLLPKL
jgi:hypothetical protein